MTSNSSSPEATVLVAEDQEHVREALAMLLRMYGYDVTLCGTPRDALTAARQQQPDIALVDMNYQRDSTSGLEGLELIQSLRDFDSLLPIVALTAWGNVDLAVKAMKYGASDFIEKPWSNDSLIDKVRMLVSRADSVRSSQRVAEYERQDAHQLQTRLVPKRHLRVGGFEIFGESYPAGVVGGDYFGAWQTSPDRLHLCIADVSGKGTPGALVAAMLYAAVSTVSSSCDEPGSIVARVESILREQLAGNHYLTIFYGVLHVPTGVLEYINAGHCPPVLLRPMGEESALAPTRPVLGLVADSTYDTCKVSLRGGDRLALYSDGIVEAVNDGGEEYGRESLARCFASVAARSLPEQHRAVIEDVRGHSAGKFSDDATLVLLASDTSDDS